MAIKLKKRYINSNKNNKGQVTLFIIMAMVIVALGVILYMFWPNIKATFGFEEVNPSIFLQTCLEEDIESAINRVSSQGGSLNPEFYYSYGGQKIEYLCYTNENYLPCVVQQPMLPQHVESEIKRAVEETARQCFMDLQESYEKRGYDVTMHRGTMALELLPQKIVASFNSSLILKKGEDSQKYESFNIVFNNNLYELISIANSILSMESTYGDSETTVYMDYYPHLKIEKKKQSEGTTIYILTERETENKFQFASRSLAWPPGYS